MSKFSYVSVQDFEDSVNMNNLNTENLSIVNLNLNSISKNLDQFMDQCVSNLGHSFDILGFCESKLTSNIEGLFTIDGYNRFTNNNSRHSGGLTLFIHKKFSSLKVRNDINKMNQHIETLFIEI